MDSVSKKCPGGASNRREPTIFKDFRDQEEGLERDNEEEPKEDADYVEKAEERKKHSISTRSEIRAPSIPPSDHPEDGRNNLKEKKKKERTVIDYNILSLQP
ncbi:hypothetical protein NDU88_002677 [Pleurodeles waltl]|uniref:Uncharacterized protein n=1 Tax=Pleurodeles waltl TaxID=8319 RepID=A0AAV7UYE6_PLEWA|nr:hypothetical protein NDU88_002677 [Pleurodeles waltl]